MTVGLVVSARCSYPILVQLRWDDVVLGLDSNPNVGVEVDDAAKHANLVDATFSLVDNHNDDHVDDMTCPVDVVVVLFLSDVVVQTSNVMLKMVVLL